MKYSDLCEAIPDELKPVLDRDVIFPLTPMQQEWKDNGVVIRRGLMPSDVVDRYCEVRELRGPQGYATPCPYMDVPEIRDLCCHPLVDSTLGELIGERMALHLNLSGWVSSERNWHEDIYLNPPSVGQFYIAVWFALGDIDPDCGPFEYVPGSHKGDVRLSGSRVKSQMLSNGIVSRIDDHWAKLSEPLIDRLAEDHIEDSGLVPQKFIAAKGDVLFWHCGLLHRGSKPNVPGMERRALIAHYTGVNHRHARHWPDPVQHGDGGMYWPLIFTGYK